MFPLKDVLTPLFVPAHQDDFIAFILLMAGTVQDKLCPDHLYHLGAGHLPQCVRRLPGGEHGVLQHPALDELAGLQGICLLYTSGPVLALDLVWTIADILNALMAIPNLVAVLLLSGVIARETRYYLDHLDEIDRSEIPMVDK